MQLARRIPIERSTCIVPRRRQIQSEWNGEPESSQQGAVAQKLGQFVGCCGNDSRAVQNVLQPGKLGKDDGRAGYLDIMPKVSRRHEFAGRAAHIDRIVVASTAVEVRGPLVLNPAAEVTG